MFETCSRLLEAKLAFDASDSDSSQINQCCSASSLLGNRSTDPDQPAGSHHVHLSAYSAAEINRPHAAGASANEIVIGADLDEPSNSLSGPSADKSLIALPVAASADMISNCIQQQAQIPLSSPPSMATEPFSSWGGDEKYYGVSVLWASMLLITAVISFVYQNFWIGTSKYCKALLYCECNLLLLNYHTLCSTILQLSKQTPFIGILTPSWLDPICWLSSRPLFHQT